MRSDDPAGTPTSAGGALVPPQAENGEHPADRALTNDLGPERAPGAIPGDAAPEATLPAPVSGAAPPRVVTEVASEPAASGGAGGPGGAGGSGGTGGSGAGGTGPAGRPTERRQQSV